MGLSSAAVNGAPIAFESRGPAGKNLREYSATNCCKIWIAVMSFLSSKILGSRIERWAAILGIAGGLWMILWSALDCYF
jgi:hypothetical protein